ncbi:GNAT family N-acetyltransferase [Actinomadura sp. ATCC 31491]|uniref:GNAT family N-acetyltransferase n=1 Tax=Actinomadura luzonensis TaxID=2805427 RepID=A0ABT0G9Q8_9ACTN|nr:GNAT family protein [Actinomadura luzonensis]MCK2221133.1 GNAT family N-acetyltransferase [Actinomadura luzonensis]
MRNWPLFDLSITTPRLVLRLPSLADLDELADRAAEGVHEEGFMPFLFPWTDGEPAERARRTAQYHFRAWGALTPEDWALEFAVLHEGVVVGTQGVMAKDFAVTREVSTGSWLGRRFHGRGIGTEMRAAVLHLAFAGLGARHAVTQAFEDNHASLAVTRKLGYREDGITLHNRRGEAAVTQRFRLRAGEWAETPGVEVHGLAPCLPLLGLDGS